MKKRIWSILLVLCMALSLLPFGALAAEVVDSGRCGDDAFYTFTSDGTLTISGEGPTDSFYVFQISSARNTAPWLDYMDEIRKVVIEDGITELGTWAFSGATELASVQLPDSLEAIGPGAFEYSAITEIVLPAAMKKIDGFSACGKLETVVLPEGAESIADGCFCDCTALKEITIPASVQTLGIGCFTNSGLTSVEIPQGVKTIPGECFSNCGDLARVMLPDSVELLAGHCFNGCGSLRAITIPASVQEIQRGAFYGCGALTSIAIPDGVTEIADGLFADCASLREIRLPDSVRRIGWQAFEDCAALESIALPSGLKELGDLAFSGCAGLTFAELPNGTQAIGKRCFASCAKLEWITIPDTVSVIGEEAFANCSALKSVRIPVLVEELSPGLFSSCKSLETVFLPQSVTSIEYNAFQDCPKLKAIYYNGTEDQLRRIRINANGNDRLEQVQVYLLSAYPDDYYGFFDLPAKSNWAYEGIAFCLDNGFMNGVGGGRFDPYGVTTRAQLVTILWRMSGEPKPTKKLPFTDCGISWADSAIAWAAENGIVNGTSAKTFSPGDPCTREQLVTIFHRYCREYLGMDVSQTQSLKKFPDAKKVSSWAKDAMEWGTAVKLINGVGTPRGDELQPQGSADRAQIARVIMNFCVNVAPTADGE